MSKNNPGYLEKKIKKEKKKGEDVKRRESDVVVLWFSE